MLNAEIKTFNSETREIQIIYDNGDIAYAHVNKFIEAKNVPINKLKEANKKGDKIKAIMAVREMIPDYGLYEAKMLCEAFWNNQFNMNLGDTLASALKKKPAY